MNERMFVSYEALHTWTISYLCLKLGCHDKNPNIQNHVTSAIAHRSFSFLCLSPSSQSLLMIPRAFAGIVTTQTFKLWFFRDLRTNQLTTLPANIFGPIPPSAIIALKGNPLTCCPVGTNISCDQDPCTPPVCLPLS
jgi:hypothetical protein